MRQYIIIYLLLIGSLAQAQSIDELLEKIRHKNHHLNAMQTEHLAIKERLASVSKWGNLQIAAGYGILPTETRLGAKRFAFSAQQSIKWNGEVNARRQLIENAAQKQHTTHQSHQIDMTQMLEKKLLMLHLLQTNIVHQKDKLELLNQQHNWTISKVESGQGSIENTLQLQIKIYELESSIQKLESREKEYLPQINVMINQALNTPIRIQDQLVVATIDSTLLMQSLANHPTLKLIQLQQEHDQQTIVLSQSQAKPQISIGLDYGIVVSRDDVAIADNGRDIIQPKIMVNIPIGREKNKATTQEKKKHIEALDQHYTYEKSRLEADLFSAWQQYQQALVDYNLYRGILEKTQAILQIQTTKYENDQINYNQLLQTQSLLVHYDFLRYKAIVDTHLAHAAIKAIIHH